MTRTIPTVTSAVAASELGFTLPHEHLQYGLPGWEHDFLAGPSRDDVRRAAISSAEAMVAVGVRTVVDLTPIETGRDLDLMVEVTQATGLQVVMATGLHSLRAVPYFVRRTERELAEIFTHELVTGAAGSSIRAAVVKTGVGGIEMTQYERTVLGAAASAAREADAAVAIHVENSGGRDAVRHLLDRGVAPHRILVAHVDSTTDLDYHLELVDHGVFLGFDRFGNERYQSDEVRIERVLELIGTGHGGQLLISQDYPVVLLGREGSSREDDALRHWSSTHLVERVLPQLRRRGLRAEDERRITHENPAKWLA